MTTSWHRITMEGVVTVLTVTGSDAFSVFTPEICHKTSSSDLERFHELGFEGEGTIRMMNLSKHLANCLTIHIYSILFQAVAIYYKNSVLPFTLDVTTLSTKTTHFLSVALT